jgi:hypothetical protein
MNAIGNQSGLLVWLVYFLAKAGIAAFLLAGLYFVISHIPERGKKFIEGMFSDGGSPSFSRVATAVLLACMIWWDTYFLYKTLALIAAGHQISIKEAMPDFFGQIAFVAMIYGVNVTGSTLAKFSNAAATDAQKQPQQ